MSGFIGCSCVWDHGFYHSVIEIDAASVSGFVCWFCVLGYGYYHSVVTLHAACVSGFIVGFVFWIMV